MSSNSLILHGLGKDQHLLAGNMAPVGLSRYIMVLEAELPSCSLS